MRNSYYKLILRIVLFFAVVTSAQAKAAAPLSDTYFLVAKTGTGPTPMDLSQCYNFQSSFPNFTSIDQFVSTYRCTVTEVGKYNGSTVVECPGASPIPDTYYFTGQEVCEMQYRNLAQYNSPQGAQNMAAAMNEGWYMFVGSMDGNGNLAGISECSPSPYNNPEEILSTGQCSLIYQNDMYKSYECSNHNDYTFVRGQNICTTTRATLLEEYKRKFTSQP